MKTLSFLSTCFHRILSVFGVREKDGVGTELGIISWYYGLKTINFKTSVFGRAYVFRTLIHP